MADRYSEQDEQLLKRLREDANVLDKLERQLAEATCERDRLRESTSELSRRIDELMQVREEWEWFFENSLEMLCIAGMDGYFKRVNPAFVRTLGYSEEELLSRPFESFVHPDDLERTRAELENLGKGKDSISFENRYRDAKGKWRWILWHCPAKAGNSENLYAIARDITSRKNREADFLYRASHDFLTSLLNRAAFEEKLQEAINRHARNPEQQVALYLVDLDRFKEVNDTWGHLAGDHVLAEIGRRLRGICRENEIVCRLGGDEFAVILEGMTGFNLEPLAWRVIESIEPPIELPDAEISLGCSIGIATYPVPSRDAHELLAHADKAMYEVKRESRAGFQVVGSEEPIFRGARA